MVIPVSDRKLVFNTDKTALKGAVKGTRIFITSAASAVLGVTTRVEEVARVGGTGTAGFVETTTGRRFSIQTGRGLTEIDANMCACCITSSLDRLFRDFKALRKKARELANYDFTNLPSDNIQGILDLIAEGEAEMARIRKQGRHVRTTLADVLKPKRVTQEEWEVATDLAEEALYGFKLPPLTEKIICRKGVLEAVTAFKKNFTIGPTSGVTRRKLIHRAKINLLKYNCTTVEIKP